MGMYVTSDLHFLHRNIIKYCPVSRSRWTADDLDKMTDDIISEFDKLPDNCDILNLGDVVHNFHLTFAELKNITERMKHGNKHLLLLMGNHDRQISKMLIDPPSKDSKECFRLAGFEEVEDRPIELNHHVFSHEPVFISMSDTVTKNVHGHTHDKNVDANYFIEMKKYHPQSNAPEELINPESYINICWDACQKFLKLEEVLKM